MARPDIDGPTVAAATGRLVAVVRTDDAFALAAGCLPRAAPDPAAEALALTAGALASGALVVRERTRGVAAVPPPERGRGEAEIFPAIALTVVAGVTSVPVATPGSPGSPGSPARVVAASPVGRDMLAVTTDS